MPVDADRAVRLCEEFLAIPSPYGAEQRFCADMRQRAEALRPFALVEADDSLLVVPRRPRPGHPRVLLAGHLDTVPELSPNPVRREGGRLYGTGSSDMKSGLGVLWAVTESVAAAPAREADLVSVLYAREEGPYERSAMPSLREAAPEWFEDLDLAVCMEPTDGVVEVGCIGTLHARVVFTGRRAHSARPWQGDNALHRAGRFLARLDRFGRRRVVRDGLEFSEVMTATGVDVRGALNVVPDRAAVEVNYRYAPGRDRASAERELAAVVREEGRIEVVSWWPSGVAHADHPRVRALVRACGGEAPRAKQAWTDVGRFSGWGIPSISWGPGLRAQAHQAGEWVAVEAIGQAWRSAVAWLGLESG